MNERGRTLLEMVLVLVILTLLAGLGLPSLRAHTVEAQLLGAAQTFKGEFLKARSIALRSNVETAIRFERQADGIYYSVYRDGNHNGVMSVDIRRGVDRRVSGPTRLDPAGVRVGINPGVPAIPPERGTLDPSDPIRFGRSEMLSFSPLGTATPGTFYLAGYGAQAAVRVNAHSGRVRLLVCRGQKWSER